jgi:hypothetical protein
VAELPRKNKAVINHEFQLKRDLRILKALAAGPTTSSYVHRQLFEGINGKPVTKQTFFARMKKLMEMGYVKVRKYRSVRAKAGTPGGIVYLLDNRGKNEVCNSFRIERDFVRDIFPENIDVLGHELQVSEIFRVAWRDVEKGTYNLEYMYDDRIMKKKIRSKESGQVFYPDIHLKILPKYKNPIALNVEVDLGTKGQSYWIRKISSWRDVSVVIALNTDRLDILKAYVRNSGRKQATGFALASEFERDGFAGTHWYWLPIESKAKLDIV